MGLTDRQLENFATVFIFILHVRNLIEGPHFLRAEGVCATDALERALGKKTMEQLYKTKTWKRGEVR